LNRAEPRAELRIGPGDGFDTKDALHAQRIAQHDEALAGLHMPRHGFTPRPRQPVAKVAGDQPHIAGRDGLRAFRVLCQAVRYPGMVKDLEEKPVLGMRRKVRHAQ